MKASELKQKFDRYEWLEDMAGYYEEHLEKLQKEGEYVTVDSIKFRCRSERAEEFKFNPHRTISATPFIKAIEQCLKDIKAEMDNIRAEIEKISVVELD